MPVVHGLMEEGVFWGGLQGHCQQNFILEAANSVAREESGASQARPILSADSLIGSSVASQGSLVGDGESYGGISVGFIRVWPEVSLDEIG